MLIFLRHCAFIFPLLAGHTLAQTNPFILSFQRNGALTWTNVLPGYSYGVQHASVLQTGAWRFTGGFTNIEPTGSTMTVQVPIVGTQGFYQVVNNGSCCTNTGGSNFITAINLGSLCGDTAGNPIVRTSCGTGWFRVTVSECSTGGSIDLRARILLTSPPGGNYDLFLYRPNATLLVSSTHGSSVDAVCVLRDDVSNDQTFEFFIEVRRSEYFGCGSWTMEVRGAEGTGCVIW